MNTVDLKLQLEGRLLHGVEQVANDLVADGRDPDAGAPSNQFADHLSPGERLPGTGRTLDGEDRIVEVCRDADGKLNGGLAGLRFKGSRSKSRRPTKEQLAGNSVPGPGKNALLDHVIGDAQKSIGKHVGVYHQVREHGGRVHVGLRPAFLHPQRATDAIDCLDAPEVRSVRQV